MPRLPLALAFTAVTLIAQGPPRMVRDLAPGMALGGNAWSSDPRDLAVIDGVALFTAHARDLGRELWRSDGTAAGTWLVRDVQPGWPDGAVVGSLVRLGRLVLFTVVADGIAELWRSDGTPAGTIRLSNAQSARWPAGLTACGHQAFFLANQSAVTEFWRTDGTVEGTRKVLDLGFFAGGPTALTGVAFDERLLFAGTDTEHGMEPWVSDGTAAGTYRLADLVPGRSGSNPVAFVRSGQRAFFANAQGQTWVTDLTASGTRLVTGRAGGVMAPVPGGVVIFQAGTTTLDLWRSDGTDPGTTRIASLPSVNNTWPTPIASTGLLYFRVDSGLWRTDGTAAGTVQLHAAAGAVVAVPGGAVFNGRDQAHGSELWRSDGSVAGTRLVADLWPGPNGSRAAPLGLRAGTCLVNAYEPEHGTELWSLDLASGTFVLVSDVWPAVPESSVFLEFGVDLVSRAWFAARDGGAWRSDGQAEGTVRAIDRGPGSYGGLIYSPLADAMLFFARDEQSLWRLWRVASGSRQAEAIAAVTPDLPLQKMVEAGGRLYFAATGPGGAGLELWRADGTAAGTALVRDLRPGSLDSTPREITALGNEVLFAADIPGGRRLWISDGSAQGTRELPVGTSTNPDPTQLVRVGDLVLFTAREPVAYKLWRTDGTTAGTWSLGPNEMYASAGEFVVAQDRIFLSVWSDERAELWVTDGSPTGAHLVKDIAPGRRGSDPRLLTALGRDVVFLCDDGVHGLEPWRSDGTEAGTYLLRDIQPGLAGSPGQPGTTSWFLYCPPGADRAVFAADDGIHGLEPWRTDGTRDGTRLLADLYPGPWPSLPRGPVLVRGQLLFGATDPAHGRELWAMSAMAAAQPEGRGCAGTGGRFPEIGSRGTPHLGRSGFAVTLRNARPLATAVLVLGRSPAALALPGTCLGLVQDVIAAFVATTDAAGSVDLAMPIPGDDALEGRVAYAQWAVLDPAGALDRVAALSGRLQIVVR